MQDELGAKDLQGALGEGALVKRNTQSDLPAQVEVGALFGLLVRDAVVGLQEQGGGQEARGHAGTTVIQDVQRGELVIAEELSTLARQETVEGIRPDEAEEDVIGLEQTALVGAFAKHIGPPNDSSAPLYHIRRPGRSFRLDF